MGITIGMSSPKIGEYRLIELDNGHYYEIVENGYKFKYDNYHTNTELTLIVSVTECVKYPVSKTYHPYVRILTTRNKTTYQIYV